MSRKCDSPGCPTFVRTGQFMCTHHWRLVPILLQRTINARYRSISNKRELLADIDYLDACARAIEMQHGPSGEVATNSYRRLFNLQQEKKRGVA